jgi:D-xylulose reductase
LVPLAFHDGEGAYVGADRRADRKTRRYPSAPDDCNLVSSIPVCFSPPCVSATTNAFHSGCGPIGLITAAVAHAYSVRKIIAFDINAGRVEFAKKYLSPLTGKPIIDHVFHISDLPASKRSDTPNGLSSHIGEAGTGGGITDGEVVDTHGNGNGDEHEETVGDLKWGWAKKRMAEILEQVGLAEEEGVDRVIEASGSEDAMLHGIAIAKQGATCE